MSTKIVPYLVLGIVIGGGLGYLLIYPPLTSKINALTMKENSLEIKIETLNHTYESLLLEYEAATQHYERLEFDYVANISELQTQANVKDSFIEEYKQEIMKLETDIEELETEVNVLNIKVQKKEYEITGLEAQYQNLENRYNVLETKYDSQLQNIKLNIGHNLTSFYDIVRYNHGPAGDKIQYLNMDREKLRYAEKLIRHDSGISEFSDIEQMYFNKIGIRSYELAKNFLDLAIYYCEINEYDTASEKIEKILEFIDKKLSYHLETDELYRAPVEMLSIGSGDCDDYSILAATLFEHVGIDTALAMYENPEHEWHMMTLVHLDDINYKHWYWTDLTYLGLKEGKWIDIDPQKLITEQGDDNWFEQWDIREARDISIIN